MAEDAAGNPAKEKGHGESGGPNDNHSHSGKDEVILDVATPKGPWKGAFPKTTKVSEVIATIVKDLGLENEPFQLIYKDKPLEPQDRPLVSFGLEGRVKLTLVATGSGV
jgi:hypothetical protein